MAEKRSDILAIFVVVGIVIVYMLLQLYCIKCSREFGKLINLENLVQTKPTIETLCEVYDKNVPWFRRRPIICTRTVPFTFSHWVDVTDPELNSQDLKTYSFVTVDFEVDFEDDETEKAYMEHAREVSEELQERYKNVEIVTRMCKKVGGKKQVIYRQTKFRKFVLFIFQLILIPLPCFVRSMIKKKVWKRIKVKKLVTKKIMEVKL